MEYRAMNRLVREVQTQEEVVNTDSYISTLNFLPVLFRLATGTNSQVSFIFSGLNFFF